MKIYWKEQFKDDFKKLEKREKDPIAFKKAFLKAISTLQAGKDISKLFPVNKIPALGEGWFDCYFYADLVLIYKIQGHTIKLYAIGKAKELLEQE